LSTIYDVTAIAVLPGYERVQMPATRIGPRRYSPLRSQDRLPIKSISLASPLEIVFWVASSSATLGVAARGFNRVALAVKAWMDVLVANVDLQQRKQALDQGRAMASQQVLEAQLRNALLRQQLQQITVPSEHGLVVRADDEIDFSSSEINAGQTHAGTHPRWAGTMSNEEFAELLHDTVDRLFGYAGGELEIAGDEGIQPESL